MNCPKCNFVIPETLIPYKPANTTTILKKKRLVFEVGEGDRKKVFTVTEPSNKKRDEYIDLTTDMARQEAEKREAIRGINEKIAAFSFPEEGMAYTRSQQEAEEFEQKMGEEMEKVTAMPNPSNRTAIEFFLGKIADDEWYEEEMVPSIVESIVRQCEDDLCHLESVRKNLESLLPQTMLLSSKALRNL